MMGITARPKIRSLAFDECEAILARNQVGRLAFAKRNRIDIVPVHFVYADGWIYGRTSRETKLHQVGRSWWPVAFEVDEIEGLFRWRSVVVHGGFYPLHSEGLAWEAEVWEKAVELLRTLIPETLREDDPVPHRSVVFRIAAQEVTGREAEPEIGAAA